MSIRTKVIALLMVLFSVFGLAELAIQRLLLYPSFLEIERESASRNVERALGALQREVELIGPSAADWARWDDTYRFVVDRNDAYREENLNAAALQSLRVQILAIYNLAGQKVWGLCVSPDAKGELDLGELSQPALPKDHGLLAGAGDTELRSGIVGTAAGPLLVVAHPILDSDGQGPARGTVVMGRLLDATAVGRIATQARIDLRIRPSAPALDGAEPVARAGGTTNGVAHTPVQLVEEPVVTRGGTTVLDIWGQPLLRLEADTPRQVTQRGSAALRFASVSLGGVGCLALVLILALLRRTVFDPVSQLTRHAIALGAGETLADPLRCDGKDEVGVLGREFQRMTEQLAETRQRLQEHSYRSGVAEMASGVLHNIGNAVTPVGVKLSNLRGELRQAPLIEMEMARAMVSDSGTPANRLSELAQFLELAGREVETLLKHTAEELDAVQAQFDHVQLILADQQRFSRAERVLEPVALARLVEENVRLLPERACKAMTVEVDPSLAQIGPVQAARVPLQQILTNLLINAAEAIEAAGGSPDTGRVRLRAIVDALDRTPVAHLEVEDNGIGIRAEHLPRLFEYGFSTKNRGSGMGLHWSANTVNALGGRLYAESQGPGTGARLHLLLPLAESQQTLLEKTA